MIAYLRRALPALIRRSRTLYALAVLGVALGVASVVSIQTINGGALAAFRGSMQAVSGEADLTVQGHGPTIDEAWLDRVLADPGVAAAWPLVLQTVAAGASSLEVVGADVFSPLRYPLASDADGTLAAALSQPGWVALTPAYAARHGLAVGDTLAISSGSRRHTLRVGALVDFARVAPLAGSKLALMDIAQAQALLGERGRLSQIDVVLADGARADAVRARLAAALGPQARVATPEQRRDEAAGLLAAFRLNLTALSLISVFVGVFLIASAIQASLARRRREFGLLRSLGATQGQVLGLILLEAGVLGLAGTLLGVPLGYAAARANVESVSGTLTSIYLLQEIERLTLPPAVVAMAAAVGIGGALLGAWWPARDTSRRAPTSLLAASALQETAISAAPRLAAAGLTVAAAALAWFALAGSREKAGGFVLALALLAALPLATPLVLREACGRARPQGFGFALAVRNLVVRLHASSFAVAGLAVTVAMLVGTTLLIGSFRRTLETWVDLTLHADVYVATESWAMAASGATLDPAFVDSLAAFPGVAAIDVQRRVAVRTASGRAIRLSGIERRGPDHGGPTSLPLLAGDPAAVRGALRAGGAVLISEPLARKEGLAVGDTLVLRGAGGAARLPVSGIGYDYSTEQGAAFADPVTVAAVAGPGAPTNLGLHLVPAQDDEAVVDRLRAAFAGRPLTFRSNARLRAEVLSIFDQTFAITRILQAMTLLIAVCGIALTLVIMARERASELALLRALGATRGQVLRLLVSEGGAMGVAGLLLGSVGGAGLAAILVLVINRVWFGWTIRFALPAGDLAAQAAVILAGALAASVHPALRGSRTAATELTREDLQ